MKIAIDGDSGTGKTTLGLAVAERIGLPFCDAGALYRAMGVLAQREDLTMADAATIVSRVPQWLDAV